MKKLLFILITLSLALSSYSGIQFGVDLVYQMDYENDDYEYSSGSTSSSSTDKSTTNAFGITPTIGILPSEIFEISPFMMVGFANYSEKEIENDSVVSEYDASQVFLGAGIGFYFHVVRGEHMHLSLGPRLQFLNYFEPNTDDHNPNTTTDPYDTYLNMSIPINVPINIDFYLNKVVGLRLTSNLLNFYINIYKRTRRDTQLTTTVKREWTDIKIDFDIITSIIPSFGLFFRF